MPNKNYKRGYEIERRIVNDFRSQGYWAHRSGGSHSRVDVTVFLPDKVLAIQVKRMKRPGTKYDDEIKEMEEYTHHPKCVEKQLWIYRDYEKRNNKWQKIPIQ